MSERKYTIHEDELSVTIFDENEEELKPEKIRELISRISESYQLKTPSSVYLMYSEKYNLHKIGITKNIKQRILGLRQLYEDRTVQVIHQIECETRSEAERLENILHKFFEHKHVSRSPDGRKLGREWFELTAEDVGFIQSENLFMSFSGTYAFHPMALLRYVKTQKGINPFVVSILAHFSERCEPIEKKSQNQPSTIAAD